MRRLLILLLFAAGGALLYYAGTSDLAEKDTRQLKTEARDAFDKIVESGRDMGHSAAEGIKRIDLPGR